MPLQLAFLLFAFVLAALQAGFFALLAHELFWTAYGLNLLVWTLAFVVWARLCARRGSGMLPNAILLAVVHAYPYPD
jgi:hypothetical protein